MDTGTQAKVEKRKRVIEVAGNVMQNLVIVIIIEDGMACIQTVNQHFVIPTHVF